MQRPRVGEPIADLCENVSLATAAESFAWVNTRQIWPTEVLKGWTNHLPTIYHSSSACGYVVFRAR